MTTVLPRSAGEARVQAGCPAQNQPGYLCAASSKGAARLAMACAAGSSAVVEAVRLGCSVSDWQQQQQQSAWVLGGAGVVTRITRKQAVLATKQRGSLSASSVKKPWSLELV